MKRAAFAAASAIISIASLAYAQAEPRVYSPQFDNEAQKAGDDIPQVQVWLDDESLRFGDIIRPYAVTEPGAYLTVVRVTADGDLRVLYPRQPWNQTRYRDGQFASDRLPVNGDAAWSISEGSGNGFVFAIASYYRFNYTYYASGQSGQWWSSGRLASAGRYGNPFEIVRRFVEEITEGSDSYSMDYVMYNVNGNGYRSRYASRYRGYAFNDYLDLCYNSFGGLSYYNYCSRYYGHGYPFVVVNGPNVNPSNPSQPSTKSMRIKPLVPDPMLPHGPKDLPAAQGRFPVNSSSENAAVARRERMLRDARPRTEPQQPMMRSDPMMRPEPMIRAEPRMAPREQPHMEPRMTPRAEQPRIEMRRADPPSPQPRFEMRASPPPPPPPREKPQKDNQN